MFGLKSSWPGDLILVNDLENFSPNDLAASKKAASERHMIKKKPGDLSFEKL